jgi:hypothetical protein
MGRIATVDQNLRDVILLFGPTAAFQEISLASRWSAEFLEIAARFDKAYEKLSVMPGAMLSRACPETSSSPNPAKA